MNHKLVTCLAILWITSIGFSDTIVLPTPGDPTQANTWATMLINWLNASIAGSMYSVKTYGATGDGTTNDTVAVQAANDAAELVNGTVLFPPGTYKIGTGLTIDASVSWRGIGATIKVKADIDIYGAYDATAKQWLTAECDRGDRDLTVTSSTGFAAGDTVIVVGYDNDDDWSLDDVRYYCEWHDVNSAPAGTTVRLDGQINGRMEMGALTADHHPAVIEVDSISVNMYDLKFLLDGDDAQMDWRVCRDSGLHNCEITGTSSDGNRFLDVRACRNFTVENCSVHDITEDGYPVWIYTSDGVQIINNNVFMSPMGFLVQWSQNIVANGNVEKYLGAYGLYFAHCIGVSATGNTISHIPWDITGYEAAPQNCNAIMLVGVENGTFTGNSTYACHGEASGIYIRNANYEYSGYTGKVEGDGLLKMPPTRNINVVGNTFIEPNELASAVAGHLGPVFGKSFGYNVNVSDNTIICGTWTAAETVRAAIGLNGEFRNCSVTNNIIHTGNAKAIYFKDDATNAFFPGSIRIENNQIVLTDDYDVLSGGIITLQDLEDDYDRGISSIRGNKITGAGQTTDEYMIYVSLQTADWTNYHLFIEDNWCKVDNDASAMRGLYVSLNATTVPSAGAVVFRNNYFDVDGVSYSSANATAFAVEQVTVFTDNDTTPDTYGLNKTFKATNSNPTSITDFLQPATGQIIQVFATNGNTTIVDGSGIETFAGANFTLATDQVVSFVYDGTDWNQIASSSPGYQKIVVKTIDVDDDASTDDYQFNDDAANATEQVITLTNILPAYAELVSWQIRCFETVTGSAAMKIDFGLSSGGVEIGMGSPDTANDIITLVGGASPSLISTNAARSLYVGGTPGANWNTLNAGRWYVAITYLDYAEAQAQ